MSCALLDANVLIALSFSDHPSHAVSNAWFDAYEGGIATCPVTQGSLLRFLLRNSVPAPDALTVLNQYRRLENHEFWPDDIGYDSAMLRGVIGHRQVTDAYLIALAESRDGSVATLDRGLAILRPKATLLISA
ncbi:MAG: PIN domain-containing protein [bacterium]|nr:PIN domain-containing protein [bacterium]MCY4102453.1 PIN domain-containing protein [bacterium]